jgi:hypothetical protein
MSASDSLARVSMAPGPEMMSIARIGPRFFLSSSAAWSSAMATSGGMNSRIWPISSW